MTFAGNLQRRDAAGPAGETPALRPLARLQSPDLTYVRGCHHITANLLDHDVDRRIDVAAEADGAALRERTASRARQRGARGGGGDRHPDARRGNAPGPERLRQTPQPPPPSA